MMEYRSRLAVVLGLAALLAPGCSTPLDAFLCETSSDCESSGQVGATCEVTQMCSYADPSCGPDGHRYGSAAGSSSHSCVEEDPDPPAADARDEDDRKPDGGTTNSPDAGGVSSPPDASVMTMIDAADSCVNVTVTVVDDFQGNDKVKVIVNGATADECSPDSVPAPTDTMALCIVCVPLGAQIDLKSESVSRLSQFTSNCNLSCGIQEKCEFTASMACSALAVFDSALPP